MSAALIRSLRRLGLAACLLAGLLCGAFAHAQPGPTVLHVATERLTDLALGYSYRTHAARLGFGTRDKPWHDWYGGSPELQIIVHLPGYRRGQPVRIDSSMVIGNRFAGKTWDSAFAALASFDGDGNGILEGPELRDLYIWLDFDGDGTIANRDDALRPVSFYYTGFDLRAGPRTRTGHARSGRIQPFAVMVPYASRIHLLELEVGSAYASRLDGLLARPTALPPGAQGATEPIRTEAGHPFNGRWRWRVTNEDQWKDPTRPWGKEAGGWLSLAVGQGQVRGVVQYLGPQEDLINLPLQGRVQDGSAQWTSVSPLGLTRSEVRLDSTFGHPVLRGRSWSNRNGKLREWTWEARYDKPLD